MPTTDRSPAPASRASSASVTIERLDKSFGAVKVISNLNVSFRAGAISVLLGSSGCGKTTILRCIAGLEEPNTGEIRIHDRRVFSSGERINVPPERRNLGMVFQSYAIWPHMTVYENVALPLKAHGVGNAQARSRVLEVLNLVGLGGLEQRSATQLSGGQQQRVAIARCLVNQPELILLDEPLSNLDAKLRIGMRGELRDLQRRLNATMIFVTHDQEEAMSLADEIFLFQRMSGAERFRRRSLSPAEHPLRGGVLRESQHFPRHHTGWLGHRRACAAYTVTRSSKRHCKGLFVEPRRRGRRTHLHGPPRGLDYRSG